MRKLAAKDIFTLARILREINIKEDVKRIAMTANSAKDITAEIGFDLIFSIIDKAVSENAEEKIFEFLAGVFEEDIEMIKEMPPAEFLGKIMQAASAEEWKSFFQRVGQLMKQN